MKQNNIRIILSIVLIALVIALVYSIARLISVSQQPVDVKADLTAKEVITSNLTSSSAVISWFSDEATEGYISYGSESGQFTTKVLDFRDSVAPSARNLFYVKITNLLPERKYYFQITQGTQTFSTPGSTYSFTTLKSTDQLGLPNPLLITAPDDFTEGIAYIHASNGDNISTTASVYSTTPNMTIDRSTLKDRNTGKSFEIGDGSILVAITSSNGKRGSASILNTEESLSIASISVTNSAYTSDTIVPAATPVSNPVSSPATGPGSSESNPIVLNSCNATCDSGNFCQCSSSCANPGVRQSTSSFALFCGGLPSTGGVPTPTPVPIPVPTPTPVPVPVPTPTPVPPPTTKPTLPSTDVNDDIAIVLNVFFGIVLLALGYQLRRNRH